MPPVVLYLPLLLWLVDAGASVLSRPGESGKADTLRSVEADGVTWVSATHLCEASGGSWRWDVLTGTLVCAGGDCGEIAFVEGMPAFRVDGVSAALLEAPARFGGDLYVAVRDAILAFGQIGPERLEWDEHADEIKSVATLVAAEVPETARVFSAVEDTSTPTQVVRGATPQQLHGRGITTIVIDAGHGGRDPGALGPGGTKEKDVVLPVALAVRDELKKRTDLTVHMTRSKDVFVELRDRTKLANEQGADLFISIHANSIDGSKKKKEQVDGYKVYFLSHAKSEDDRRVAMLENSVVQLERESGGGDFLQGILVDMAANEYLIESQDLSITIAETFGRKLKKVQKIHTGVGQGPFWVLYGATMPSVLIEIGYISNPREEKVLAEGAFQRQTGKAICDALLEFKAKYERGL